jgi:hypothetical protein
VCNGCYPCDHVKAGDFDEDIIDRALEKALEIEHRDAEASSNTARDNDDGDCGVCHVKAVEMCDGVKLFNLSSKLSFANAQ